MGKYRYQYRKTIKGARLFLKLRNLIAANLLVSLHVVKIEGEQHTVQIESSSALREKSLNQIWVFISGAVEMYKSFEGVRP